MTVTVHDRDRDVEREQVEQVFGLTGGELSDEPWVYWTQQESSTDGSPLWDKDDESHVGGMVEWHEPYWYEGAPEYAERELRETQGGSAIMRTLVNRGGMLMGPHWELYDGDGVWKLIDTFGNSGEAPCPYREWDPISRTDGGEWPRKVQPAEVPNYSETGIYQHGDHDCPLCEEKVGEEHGYIYLGVCCYEAVYVLEEQSARGGR